MTILDILAWRDNTPDEQWAVFAREMAETIVERAHRDWRYFRLLVDAVDGPVLKAEVDLATTDKPVVFVPECGPPAIIEGLPGMVKAA